MVRNTIGRFERLDALINNASTFFPTPVGEMTQATWTASWGRISGRRFSFASCCSTPQEDRRGDRQYHRTSTADRPLKN